MILPSLKPTFIFGLKQNIRGNVHYLSDQEILYPVGAVINIHNINTNQQKYLELQDKLRPISAICITENRKFLATAEKGDPPVVTLYDLTTFKQKKTWVLSRTDSPEADELVSISFSHDGKLLAGITGNPDWQLLCYNWEKNKVESSAKAQNPVCPGPILQVSFCPEDTTIVCIVGPGCLRFLQHIETSWNQFGFAKSELLPVTSFCWISQGKVLAGTRDGRLMLLEDGELRAMYLASEIQNLNTRTKALTADGAGQNVTEQYIGGTPGNMADATIAALEPFGTMPGSMEVNPIISFSKGFAFGYGLGYVYVFWRESDHHYRKQHVFKVPSLSKGIDIPIDDNMQLNVAMITKDTSNSILSGAEKTSNVVRELTSSSIDTSGDLTNLNGSSSLLQQTPIETPQGKQEETLNPLDSVRCICTNPAQSELIISTGRNQLYCTALWNTDYNQDPLTILHPMGEELHDGPVSGLSVCMLKSLFVTCGEFDKSVRVWNFETLNLELVKRFEDDLFCIDIHPTGLHVIVGFSDKLRFMNLLIDDLEEKREIPIRKCKGCLFSYSGHLFAATNSTIIQIYSSLTFELLYSFKGHKKRIHSLSWTKSDYHLVSCGYGGFIYEWDLPTKKRVSETVSSVSPFTYAVVSSDGSCTYASGADGRLSEINQSKVTRFAEWKDLKFNTLMLSHLGKMIFAADDDGSVIVPQLPLSDHGEWAAFNMHNTPIRQMAISHNDRQLITASEDGSICIWKVEAPDSTAIKLDQETLQSKEILISKEDLQGKVELIQDLTTRVQHLELEHAYKMKQSQDQHFEKMREIQDTFYKELKEVKELNEAMESKHAKEINLMNDNIVQTKSLHEAGVHKMETEYNDKLIREYEKYAQLEEHLKKMKEQYEMKLEQLRNDKEIALQDLGEIHHGQIQQKIAEIHELNEQAQNRSKEHEEIKAQIEDDVDREMIEVKTRYERMLKEERDTNVRLRGEVGAVKKKLVSSQKEIDEYKHQVHTLQSEQIKYKQAIQGLEKDIAELKREIQERDTTIHYKEKRIYDLQRKNQELEKYKFVLNFKITELKNQKEPREREIKENKEQIQDMEKELGILQSKNEMLELKIKYCNEKLASVESELKNQRLHSHTLNTLAHRMRCDIYYASGLIQNAKQLKEFVKLLNTKYNEDKAVAKTQEEDVDASVEFQRQREHLERTLSTLKCQLQKETRRNKKEHLRIMTENVTLISEINTLRVELKSARKHIHEMEAVIGVTGKGGNSKEAQSKLQAAIKSHDEIHESYAKKMENYEKLIQMQKDEIHHLNNKVHHLQELTTSTSEEVK